MTGNALIVAHGQPSDPAPPEAEMRLLARQVAENLPGWRVRSATLAAPDALKTALHGFEKPIIFPFFMADGWFIRSLLPRRLTEAGAGSPRVLTPFGLLPATADLAATMLREAIEQEGWAAPNTVLVLAAHGSGRSPYPAEAARAMQSAIAKVLPFAESRLGFIEEAPDLAEVAANTGTRAICLPLFVARWGHVETDIPAALGTARFKGLTLPPLGADLRVPGLVARAIAKGASASP